MLHNVLLGSSGERRQEVFLHANKKGMDFRPSPKKIPVSLEAVNQAELEGAGAARSEELIGGLHRLIEVRRSYVVVEAGEVRVHETTDVRRVGQVEAFADQLQRLPLGQVDGL